MAEETADTGFELSLTESGDGDYPLLPDGHIVSVVVDAVEKKAAFKAGDPDRIKFKFVVTEDGEFKGQWLWGSTPTTFSDNPDCKLMSWVRELLGGEELPAGFTISNDTLKGLEGRVSVSQYPDYKDPEKMRNGVENVLRPKGTAAAAVSAALDGEEPF